MTKAIILGILVFGLTLMVVAKDDVVEKGKVAPNFTVEDLDGNMVCFFCKFYEKVILLNFWSLYCGPCRAEMPYMEKLYQEFKDDGLVVVAVNWGDNKEAVRKFVRENNLTFTMLLDPNEETAKKYPTRGIPYSIIIDRKGIVRDIVIGSRQWDSEEMKAYFKKLLGEK